MLGAVRVGLLAVVAVLLGLLAWPAQAAQASGLSLDISSSKAEYVPGEDIRLTFRVTNHGSAPCQVVTVPDGAVFLTAVMHEASPVPWHTQRVDYYGGYGALLTSSLKTLAPGDHVDFTVDGAASTDPTKAVPLRTVSPLPTEDGLATAWVLGPTGRYTVSAGYAVPHAKGSSPCVGSTNTATVAFTVGEPSAFPWLLVIAGAVGLLILLILILLLVRRGRRRVAVPLIAGLLSILGIPLVHPGSARADAGIDAFTASVDECLTSFNGPGGDPAKIMPRITDDMNKNKLKIGETMGRGALGDRTDPVLGLNGNGERVVVGATVGWNPNDTDPLPTDPGVHPDKCGDLYHELVHADDIVSGTEDTSLCHVPGVVVHPGAEDSELATYNEVKATLWENAYRDAHHDVGQRSNYSGRPLPKGASVEAALATCKPETASQNQPQKPPGAQTNGDPHLTTFDFYRYDFQAVGEFIAAKSAGDFEIQVRQSPYPGDDDRTVSVNSAVAMRVGADRVGFYFVNGDMAVHIGGKVESLPQGSTKLPGGGSVTRREGQTAYTQDGYDVTWPDGSSAEVDVIGSWGIRVNVYPAEKRRHQFTGLLGNFDGDPTNDLVTRDGKALPQKPDFDQLYHTFGDSWRISQSESLFDYASGETTEKFTDRTYPARPRTVNDLTKAQRDEATAACRSAGVTDSTLLDQCVLDVALTGQPAFGVNSGQAQRGLPAKAGQPTPVPTNTGQTLHDGDTVTGTIDQPGQTNSYQVELADGAQFELLDVTGKVDAQLIGAESAPPMLPGPYQYSVKSAGRFTLRVAMIADTGKYGFRFVTLKPRRIPIEVGGSNDAGKLDVPGRVDIYTFTSTDADSVRVVSTSPCDNGLDYGFDADSPTPAVRTPGQLCFDYAHPVDRSTPQVFLVWSEGAKTVDYKLSLKAG